MSLILELVTATSALPMIDVPDINADFSPPPIRAALKLANQILAGGVVAAIIAGIVITALLLFAGLDSRGKSKAWTALGVAAIAMAVMGSITGMLTFFGNIPLF